MICIGRGITAKDFEPYASCRETVQKRLSSYAGGHLGEPRFRFILNSTVINRMVAVLILIHQRRSNDANKLNVYSTT